MKARHVAYLVLLLLAAAGIRHAVAQNDPFQQAACQEEFVKRRSEIEKRGMALKGAQKLSAAEACKLLRNFTAAEGQMLKFLNDKKSTCSIPDQVIQQAGEGHAKSLTMREQVCKVAASQAAPPAPPPSQGLSGALGNSALGGPPPEVGGGTGVFDTLTGNVLRQ
jgi:hypothetical protein